MKRLTWKDESGYYAPKNVTLNCLKQRGEIVDRLAAYEDTGLSPGELKAKCAWADKMCKTLSDIFGDSGVFDFSHFKELSKAEQDGRLVVLPCKYSPVWFVEEATNNCDTVSDKDCMSRPNCEGCPAVKSYVRRVDEFYLTLEDAKKALEGVNEDD